MPFHSFSGIVDTDKHPVPVNFPFVVKKDFEGVIPAGTPIAQFIFLKRDTLEYEVCEASQIDMERTKLKEKRIRLKNNCSFFDEKYFDYIIDEQLSND